MTVAAEICGLPRTGSTLLHRLLASSPLVTTTLSWETSYPLPFPGEGPDAEQRKKRARDRFAMFLEMAPDFGDIHTIEWDGPEEDVIVLDRTFTSMSFDSFYWVPSYGDWLRAFDQAPAYRELREWLQALQWQDPSRQGRPWVLKSPHHLTAVDTVLDTFDGCKIVMTHRSPTRAVPSYASMVCAISGQYSDDVDPLEVGPYWRDRFVVALKALSEVRERRPDRIVDVDFKDQMSDPVGTAARVLGELGIPADRRGARGLHGPATRKNGTGRTRTPPRTSDCPRRSWSRTSRSIRRLPNEEYTVILKDEVVIVSGVGAGLGAKMASRAAAEGAKVVMAARSSEVMDQIAKEVAAAGGEAVAVPCDVRKPEDVARVAETAV